MKEGYPKWSLIWGLKERLWRYSSSGTADEALKHGMYRGIFYVEGLSCAETHYSSESSIEDYRHLVLSLNIILENDHY
jgi:hypothetical protein